MTVTRSLCVCIRVCMCVSFGISSYLSGWQEDDLKAEFTLRRRPNAVTTAINARQERQCSQIKVS